MNGDRFSHRLLYKTAPEQITWRGGREEEVLVMETLCMNHHRQPLGFSSALKQISTAMNGSQWRWMETLIQEAALSSNTNPEWLHRQRIFQDDLALVLSAVDLPLMLHKWSGVGFAEFLSTGEEKRIEHPHLVKIFNGMKSKQKPSNY